jgi:hypothetical protein
MLRLNWLSEVALLKSRKVYFTPYPRFTRLGKTRICLWKSRNVYFTPYPRFTRLGKTRIFLWMSRKVYFTPYPHFTRSGKTRICLWKSRKVYFTPYPRFTRSGKTRIWCLKHILEKNRSSVRPFVRPSVRPYQRFTRTPRVFSIKLNIISRDISPRSWHRDRYKRNELWSLNNGPLTL